MYGKLRLVWAISLIVLGICALLNAANSIFGFLPDMAVRVTGIISLIALPVLVFTSVRTMNKRNDSMKK